MLIQLLALFFILVSSEETQDCEFESSLLSQAQGTLQDLIQGPVEGVTKLTVPSGSIYTLDESLQLNGTELEVAGTLLVGASFSSPTSQLELTIGSIHIVDGGYMHVGSSSCPLKAASFDVRLGGQVVLERGGRLSVVGRSDDLESSFWPLSADINPGDSMLSELASEGFSDNDDYRLPVLVTDTDFWTARRSYSGQQKLRTFAEVVYNTSEPLLYRHSGSWACGAAVESGIGSSAPDSENNHDCVDTRAHVAPLGRRITFSAQAPSDSSIAAGLLLRGEFYIASVAFNGLGQAGAEQVYPVHALPGAPGSVLRSCVVRDSSMRAIVLEQSQNLLILDNVVHTAPGLGVALVTGAEINNVVHGNLVSNIYQPTSAETLYPIDRDDRSSFFLANPMNSITGNVAAGQAEFGFYFLLPFQPIGSFAAEYPDDRWRYPIWYMPLTQFSDNIAYGVDYALRFVNGMEADFSCCEASFRHLPRHVAFPLTDEWLANSQPDRNLNASVSLPNFLTTSYSSLLADYLNDLERFVRPVFTRLTAHHIRLWAVYLTQHTDVHGIRIADARYGVYMVRGRVSDAVFIGESSFIGNPEHSTEEVGYRTRPDLYNSEYSIGGVFRMTYGGLFYVKNARFYNYTDEVLPSGLTRPAYAIMSDPYPRTSVMPPLWSYLDLKFGDKISHALYWPLTDGTQIGTEVFIDQDGSIPNGQCGDLYIARNVPIMMPPERSTGADQSACVEVPEFNAFRCPEAAVGRNSLRMVSFYDRDGYKQCDSCGDMQTACPTDLTASCTGGLTTNYVDRNTIYTRLSDGVTYEAWGDDYHRTYLNLYVFQEYAVTTSTGFIPLRLRHQLYYCGVNEWIMLHIPYPKSLTSAQFFVGTSVNFKEASSRAELEYMTSNANTWFWDRTAGVLSVLIGRRQWTGIDKLPYLTTSPWLDIVIAEGVVPECTKLGCAYDPSFSVSSLPSYMQPPFAGFVPPPHFYGCFKYGNRLRPLSLSLPEDKVMSSDEVSAAAASSYGRLYYVNDWLNPETLLASDSLNVDNKASFRYLNSVRMTFSIVSSSGNPPNGLTWRYANQTGGIMQPPMSRNTYLRFYVRPSLSSGEPAPLEKTLDEIYIPYGGTRGSDDSYTDTWLRQSNYGRLHREFVVPAVNVARPREANWYQVTLPMGEYAAQSDNFFTIRFYRTGTLEWSKYNFDIDEMQIVDLDPLTVPRDDDDLIDDSWSQFIDELAGAGSFALTPANVHKNAELVDTRRWRTRGAAEDESEFVLLPAASSERTLATSLWRKTRVEPSSLKPVSRIANFEQFAEYVAYRYNLSVEYREPPLSNEHVNAGKHWSSAQFLDTLWPVAAMPDRTFEQPSANGPLSCSDDLCPLVAVACPALFSSLESCVRACEPHSPSLRCLVHHAEEARQFSEHCAALAPFGGVDCSDFVTYETIRTLEDSNEAGDSYDNYGDNFNDDMELSEFAYYRASPLIPADAEPRALVVRFASTAPVALYVSGQLILEESPDTLRSFAYWSRELRLSNSSLWQPGQRLVVGFRVAAETDPLSQFDAEVSIILPPGAAKPGRLAESSAAVTPAPDAPPSHSLACNEGEPGCTCDGLLRCSSGVLHCSRSRCVDVNHMACSSEDFGRPGCPCLPEPSSSPSGSDEDPVRLFPGRGNIDGSCSSENAECNPSGFCVFQNVCERGNTGCLCRDKRAAANGSRCQSGSGCALVMSNSHKMLELCVEDYLGYDDLLEGTTNASVQTQPVNKSAASTMRPMMLIILSLLCLMI